MHILKSWQLYSLAALFISIRVVSFFTRDLPLVQSIITALVILFLGLSLIKNRQLADKIIVGELVIGGAGSYFSLIDLSLRTWLIVAYVLFAATTYFVIKIKNSGDTTFVENLLAKAKSVPGIAVILLTIGMFSSAAVGIINHHPIKMIVGDSLPFLYIFLIIPFKNLLRSEDGKKFIIAAAGGYAVGMAVTTLAMLSFFSLELNKIQDPLYKWWRNIGGGKMTDMGYHYFRVVVPEQMLAVFVSIGIVTTYITKKISTPLYSALLTISLIPLSETLTRTYILALAIGLSAGWFVIKNKKRVILAGVLCFFILTLQYSFFHLLTSRGQSLGVSLFGSRFAAIVRPSGEESALSRQLLLKPMIVDISKHPIIGNGLGASISFADTKTRKIISTRFLDWGYLEMALKLGIPVAALYTLTLVTILKNIISKAKKTASPLAITGALSLISLLAMAVTSSALTHVLGISLVAFAISTNFTSFPDENLTKDDAC